MHRPPAPEALPVAWMAEHEDDSKDFVNFYEDVCRQQAEDSGARRVIPLYAAPEALGAAGVSEVAKIVDVDEYGPQIQWSRHWVELNGRTLYVKEQS